MKGNYSSGVSCEGRLEVSVYGMMGETRVYCDLIDCG